MSCAILNTIEQLHYGLPHVVPGHDFNILFLNKIAKRIH